MPHSRLDQIRKQYTSEEQRKAAMVKVWLDSSPSVSWVTLAGGLYHKEEKTALEEVKGYLQKQQGTDRGKIGYVYFAGYMPLVTSAMT